MNVREINFYRNKSGMCPVEDFLDSLAAKQVKKIAWVLRFIEETENISSYYLKKMVNTDDIWEVRVQVGNNIFRLLGFFENERLLILLHAFQKKTQKTPRRAIEIAEKRKKDFLERGH